MIKKTILRLVDSLGYKISKKDESKIMQRAFLRQSWSQEGEDLILARYFNKSNGVFVDIGAHHPYRYSNTFRFYKRGWRGLNIDPLPGTKGLFDKERPEDITLEIAISNTTGYMDYYMFELPELNTFSKSQADSYNQKWEMKEIRNVKVTKLKDVFEDLKFTTEIDFMTVDVEGHEMEVLQSNDWEIFRPEVLLIENLDCRDPLINEYLTDLGYRHFANTINTQFFKRII